MALRLNYSEEGVMFEYIHTLVFFEYILRCLFIEKVLMGVFGAAVNGKWKPFKRHSNT